MKKLVRPDSDNLEELKLTPKQIQLLVKSYESEISDLKIEMRKLIYAVTQIRDIRRNLSTRSFDESLSIGMIANNVLSNLPREFK